MRLLRGRLRVPAAFALAALVLFVAAPALLSDFRLNLLAKYLCFAMIAVGIGLAWGRGGMLTLGQGVFFGLGGVRPNVLKVKPPLIMNRAEADEVLEKLRACLQAVLRR